MGSRLSPNAGRTRFRPAVEVLEGRECPAVTASFAGGILTVVGDDTPNQVALVELGGGAVRVVGDGQTFQFQGVKGVVVHTLAGNDRVEYGPESAAVAPAVGDRELTIDVGAGDDRVTVRDHAAKFGQTVTFTATIHADINLGTGKDYVLTSVRHSDIVELDITSTDGRDEVLVGMLLPAVQKVREASARTHLDLVPGGNLVDVSAENYDDVDVAITTAGRGTAPAGPGDRFTLTFSGQTTSQVLGSLLIAKQRAVLDLGGADDRVTIDSRGFADLGAAIATGAGKDNVVATYSIVNAWPNKVEAPIDLDLRLGDGDDRLDAELTGYPDARLNLDFGAGDDRGTVRDLATGRPAAPPIEDAALAVGIDLGTGADRVAVSSHHHHDVGVDVFSSDGGDSVELLVFRVVQKIPPHHPIPRGRVEIDLGAGGNVVSVATKDVDDVEVSVKTSDRAGTGSIPPDRYSLSFDGVGQAGSSIDQLPSKLKLAMNLSGADDRVKIDANGFSDVSADIDTGAGNDTQVVRWNFEGAWPSKAPPTLDFDTRLGAGDDRLDARFVGYPEAELNLDLGAGDDRANVRVGSWIMDVSYRPTLRVAADLGAGDDFLRLDTRGYHEVRMDLDTGPAGDGQDQIVAGAVLPAPAGPRQRHLTTLHSFDVDRYYVFGVEYPTADIHLEGNECQVFLLGGIP